MQDIHILVHDQSLMYSLTYLQSELLYTSIKGKTEKTNYVNPTNFLQKQWVKKSSIDASLTSS